MVEIRDGGEIVVQNVTKVFEDKTKKKVYALNNVNLEVKAGEFISLIGPSGCGKSTLLRLITGLDFPTIGEVTLDGEQIKGPDWLKGLVFQDPTLFPWRTVQQNIETGLLARGILNSEKEEIEKFIELVGLKGFEKAYPHQLSGGMAQRVALARALINRPKVLLLDEPLGALDAFTRMKMQDELLKLWEKRGTTMIFVTHDIDEAIYLSDRVVVMTPRPAKIKEIISINLPRPRQRNGIEFFEYRSRILESLHLVPEKIEPEFVI